jgi:hypothetical protein
MNVWVTCPCGAESIGLKNVPFNYPKAILWLGRLVPFRLSVADGDWLGPVLIVAFLLVMSFSFHGTTFWQAAYFCALIASPPLLFAIERANYDLALFCLIFLNVRFLDRLSNAGSYAVTFGLGMLKLYPIAAVLGLIRKTKRSRILFWLTVAAEVIFIIFSFNNIRVVANLTPRMTWQSFGYAIVFLIVSGRFKALAWVTKIMLPIFVAVLVTLAYFTRRARQYWLCILNGGDMKYRSLFIAGGAIYSVCFAFGANFNYRFVFLLFTVPYLFSMQRVNSPQRSTAGLILITLLCAFWLTAIDGRTSVKLLQAGMTWLLFIFFASLCLTVSFDSLLEKTTARTLVEGNRTPVSGAVANRSPV